jgi:hypothetical protein
MSLKLTEKFSSLIKILESAEEEEIDLLGKYAALKPEDRKKIIDYWKNLSGGEYATDLVKDYINTGKKTEKKTEASVKKEAMSSENSGSNKKVKEYYDNLYGSEYAKDMTSYEGNSGEKMEVEAGLSKGLKSHLSSIDPKLANEILELLTFSKKKEN